MAYVFDRKPLLMTLINLVKIKVKYLHLVHDPNKPLLLLILINFFISNIIVTSLF